MSISNIINYVNFNNFVDFSQAWKGVFMGFRESINGFLRLCNLGDSPYRITMLGNSAVYIEGVLKILDVAPCKIMLLVKSKKLILSGENLTLSSFVEKDVVVSGKVDKIEWQD